MRKDERMEPAPSEGGTTTHNLVVPAGEYMNISNGNLNCALFIKFNQFFRVHIGGTQPAADTLDWFDIGGEHKEYAGYRLAFKIGNLAAEDDVWIMPFGEYDSSIVVVRGVATSAAGGP